MRERLFLVVTNPVCALKVPELILCSWPPCRFLRSQSDQLMEAGVQMVRTLCIDKKTSLPDPSRPEAESPLQSTHLGREMCLMSRRGGLCLSQLGVPWRWVHSVWVSISYLRRLSCIFTWPMVNFGLVIFLAEVPFVLCLGVL